MIHYSLRSHKSKNMRITDDFLLFLLMQLIPRLFQNSQFFGAPHLLGVSELAMERIYRSMASDMVAVLQGQLPKYCVNPEVISTIQ